MESDKIKANRISSQQRFLHAEYTKLLRLRISRLYIIYIYRRCERYADVLLRQQVRKCNRFSGKNRNKKSQGLSQCCRHESTEIFEKLYIYIHLTAETRL